LPHTATKLLISLIAVAQLALITDCNTLPLENTDSPLLQKINPSTIW